MKKIIFALFIIVLMLPAVHSQSLGIAVSQINPQPVEPGNDLTLQISYTNFGNTPILGAQATIDLRSPFSLKASTENYESGVDICSFCSRTNTYFIHTDPAAKSGNYPIFIRLNSAQAQSVQTIYVSVIGRPNIIVSSTPINNATASSDFLMELRLTNIGSGTAKQIKITSKSTDFIALGGSVQSIESLPAGAVSQADFDMSPGLNLKAGSYNIPFEINFKDELGNSYNITQSVGIQIINVANIDIEDFKISPVSGGGLPTANSPITLVVRLQNIGRGDANSIQSQISCGNKTSSSSSAFLGQLKSDEDAPAVFNLVIPSGGRNACILTTNYEDDTGRHTITNNLELNLFAPEFPVISLVIVIIIIGVLAYFFRKRRRKEKKG
jgi:hypothetical protein